MARSRWTIVTLALSAPLVAGAAACGDDPARPPDGSPPVDSPPPDTTASPCEVPMITMAPATLAGTGLCMDRGCMQICAGVREYTPRASFWDDSATKRRWIYLPPGTRIDTADMDHWVFPIGTKIWKEFTRDGTRVETRLLAKQLPDDMPGAWTYATYQWNPTQDQAAAITTGVQNANGTQHDIPTRSDCRSCHERLLPSRVLGFEAIQLDDDAPAGQLDLEELIAADLITVKPAGAAPRFSLPGADVDRAALIYLHANCGHCHNPTSDLYAGETMIDLRLTTVALGSVTGTPAYMSTVDKQAAIPYTENGVTYTKLIVPKKPEESAVISRMNSTQSRRFMPNAAVETVDPAGQAALVAWIMSL